MFSLSDHQVDAMVENGERGARARHRLKEDPHRLLVTILVGNNLVNITVSSVSTTIVGFYLDAGTAVIVSSFGITSMVLLFGSEGVHAVVEAKQIGRDLTDVESQIRRYIRLFDATWGLLTNGEQYRIYRATDDGAETHGESSSLPNLAASTHLQELTRQSAYGEPDDTTQVGKTPTPSEEAKRRIIELSDRADVYDVLVDSFAPSVYGHEQQKLAVLLSLFGGVDKHS